MSLLVLFGVFFFCLVIGVPVAFSLGIAAFVGFIYEGLPLFIATQQIVSGISVFSLLAIPFFIFAGELMLQGGIAARLVRLASAAVGWMRGGLGVVNVTSSMLFGGISGSAVADTSALGSILMPVMKEKGYDGDYAVNVTVTSSIAGIVIPPSHNMIIYAIAAGGLPISQLFLAGVVPGILMCMCLAFVAWLVAVKRGYPSEPFPGLSSLTISFIVALPGLMTAIIIVGGVLSGIMTVTESGAFGAIYATVVTALVYRELTWEKFKQAVLVSVRITSMAMVLIACASAFAYLLTLNRVPDLLAGFVLSFSESKFIILLLLNCTFLLLGMIMDMAALILITTPIFLPIIIDLGMSPIQFGIIMMMNLGLGLTTPPVGACLFVGCVVGNERMEHVVKTIWPFYLAILFALLLVTYIPAISLGLGWILEL
jgi:tripartite ATP-independent transporter DctM subunit